MNQPPVVWWINPNADICFIDVVLSVCELQFNWRREANTRWRQIKTLSESCNRKSFVFDLGTVGLGRLLGELCYRPNPAVSLHFPLLLQKSSRFPSRVRGPTHLAFLITGMSLFVSENNQQTKLCREMFSFCFHQKITKDKNKNNFIYDSIPIEVTGWETEHARS